MRTFAMIFVGLVAMVALTWGLLWLSRKVFPRLWQ